MHILVCFEGTSYTGKTTVAKLLSEKILAIYGPRVANGWEKAEQEIHKNSDPLARVSFFMKEVVVRSKQVSRMLEQTNVVLDRYLLSIFGYHNVIVGKRFETEIDVSALRQPDCTVLLTVTEAAMMQRMKNRPPRHRYESDPVFLLNVQHEFLRLINQEKTIVIDTSFQPAEEIVDFVMRELVKWRFVHYQLPQRE